MLQLGLNGRDRDTNGEVNRKHGNTPLTTLRQH
jgi:hypothetical protein